MLVVLLACCTLTLVPQNACADSADVLLKKAQAAVAKGQLAEALTLADQAAALEPKNAGIRYFRGRVHEAARRHKEATADYTQAIELDGKSADAYNRRGGEYFKLGQIAESIADFDKFLELRPEQMPGHWQRGISYYYAGRFEDGWKQFKGYEKVDTNDVENAVWHYICLARVVGADKARASMLKIGFDKRVPLMQLYELFKGQAKPEDVLAAANNGNPPAAELRTRLFYAHLYLGLYYESLGDKKKTLEHMTKAAEDYSNDQYMGDVARVHLGILRKRDQGK
jgi:lipoprotein NlpI